jgi:hypothetical protein
VASFPWQLLAFIAVVGLIGFFSHRVYDASRRRHLRTVEAQFEALRHDVDGDARSSYDGKSATVVYQFLDEPRPGNTEAIYRLTIHRVFRNAHGEYFLFISGEPPYVTHLSRERAMHALSIDSDAFRKEFGSTPL